MVISRIVFDDETLYKSLSCCSVRKFNGKRNHLLRLYYILIRKYLNMSVGVGQWFYIKEFFRVNNVEKFLSSCSSGSVVTKNLIHCKSHSFLYFILHFVIILMVILKVRSTFRLCLKGSQWTPVKNRPFFLNRKVPSRQ